jgi:1-acyl-sn-glycerol-3-phosphate acyltransferase
VILFSILRAVVGALFFAVYTIIWSGLVLIAAIVIGRRDLDSWFISTWGKVGLAIFGVRLQVRGRENIPAGSALFIFNHTSFFDIFALSAAFPDVRFGAKIELFRIPVFGAAMRRMGMLPIARTRREEVFKVYEDAAERVRRGEKFALAPEGGRNNEEKLLPFKSGPFIFAINSGMPLVPVVIKGAHEILGKGGFLPNWDRPSRTLTVTYLKPIETKSYSIEKRSELQKVAYREMDAVLHAP